jgi:hypothetical protein
MRRLAVVIAFLSVGSFGNNSAAVSESPISWERRSGASPASAEVAKAADAASTWTGLPPDHTDFVRLTDRRPFGRLAESDAWLSTFEHVRITLERGKESYVTLYVAVSADTKEPFLAFTPASSVWPERTLPARDPKKAAEKNGWAVTPVEGRVTGRVQHVLSVLNRNLGLDPAQCGQIILRPRYIANKWPAKTDDGERIPVLEPQNVWIFEILGTVILDNVGPDGKQRITGMVGQILDKDLKFIRGISLP